mmetsp:Transcript_88621/g.225605  ORF Transcript_88621/g.225605 Transcript_88621/m.225605 type:complete len:357 (-) Transcript_88621:501-1571(-)
MVQSVQLSRDSAVRLAAELSELAVKLRILEAKYGLEDDGLGGPAAGLGLSLLAALRPFAKDAEVAAITLGGGLDLEACLLGLDLQGLTTFAKQVSCESVSSDLSTSFGPSERTAGSTISSALGFPSRSTTEESVLAPSVAAATPPASASAGACAGSGAGVGAGTGGGGPWLRVVPRLSGAPRRWHARVEGCCAGGRALELRRKLSIAMQLPLGKIRVMAEQEDGSSFILDDEALAERATGVYVCGVPAAVSCTSKGGAPSTSLSRDQALAMQQELLEALGEPGSTASGQAGGSVGDRLKEAHNSVLPKYGFRTSPAGVAAMLKAFDEHASDGEIATGGDTINQSLGLRPQFYSLEK